MSCSNDIHKPLTNEEYIIFGHFYGSCLGENCIEIYKLTNTELLEDQKDEYPSSEAPYEGEYQSMSQEKYELVKGLSDKIPSALLNEESHLIGTPDAADNGGLYFEYYTKGKRYFWLIDQVDDYTPDYLKPFKKEINKSIKKLNE